MVIVTKLVWDETNIAHIAKHGVTPAEVEEVCFGQYVVFDARYGRFLVIGPTGTGRGLAIVLDPEAEKGSYYPVTARPADRGERKKYLELKGVKL